MNERVAATKSDAKKWATLPRPHKINLPRPDTSAAGKILHLQQSTGNQVVQRLFESGIIQAKVPLPTIQRLEQSLPYVGPLGSYLNPVNQAIRAILQGYPSPRRHFGTGIGLVGIESAGL